MLTRDDLRWAEGAALKQVADLRFVLTPTCPRCAKSEAWKTDPMVIRYQATAARFRAAAEAMEREGLVESDFSEAVVYEQRAAILTAMTDELEEAKKP